MDKFRRIVGVILILVGVFIVGDVVYKKIETNKKQQQMIDLFEGQITGEKQEGENASQEVVSLDDINGYSPIAIMEIPRIKLKQAIVTGIDDNTLQYFLGHFPDSAMPGEVGNFAVAGHRVSDYTDAFINLYKVEKGDEVIVRTVDKKYTYVVEDNFIVNPDQVEVLENTDTATMTFITCTVGSKQRVIVKGSLISTEEL